MNYLQTFIKVPESRKQFLPELSNVESSPWMSFLQEDVLNLVKLTKEDLRMFDEDPIE